MSQFYTLALKSPYGDAPVTLEGNIVASNDYKDNWYDELEKTIPWESNDAFVAKLTRPGWFGKSHGNKIISRSLLNAPVVYKWEFNEPYNSVINCAFQNGGGFRFLVDFTYNRYVELESDDDVSSDDDEDKKYHVVTVKHVDE